MEQISQLDFASKRKLLASAKEKLKQEFFGIDSIIDSIVKQISPWYFFPELQERPTIINLWGLTGVGKTALVERLAYHIHQSDYYYRFDLGTSSHSSFSDGLRELFDSNILYPKIIVLDEFQHSKTKTESNFEIEFEKNRIVWDFIDSGLITFYERSFSDHRRFKMLTKLTELLYNGVEVKDGLVVARFDLFLKEAEDVDLSENKIKFISRNAQEHLEGYLNEINIIDIEGYLSKLDTIGMLNLIEKTMFFYNKPQTKSFKNSLVFIIGNLDEAFEFSGNFSQKIEADEFHRISKRIDIIKIKKALQSRFRNEQIARLGNNHIIYPSLSEKAFYQIINKELTLIQNSIYEKLKIKLTFDISVKKLIYKIGVFPTQGVRPILTTIDNIIKSNLFQFYADLAENEAVADSIQFSALQNKMAIEAFANSKSVLKITITELISTKSQTINDRKAIIAVHETGHAILMAKLMNALPNVICIADSEHESQLGFVYSNEMPRLLVKSEVTKMVAISLGGYLAEKIVFGEANVSVGAQNDIEKATEQIIMAVKEYGFTGKLLKFKTSNVLDNYTVDDNGEMNVEITKLYSEALELAESELNNHKTFLINFSKKLLEKELLYKHQLKGDFEEILALNGTLTDSFKELQFTPILMNFSVEKPKLL